MLKLISLLNRHDTCELIISSFNQILGRNVLIDLLATVSAWIWDNISSLEPSPCNASRILSLCDSSNGNDNAEMQSDSSQFVFWGAEIDSGADYFLLWGTEEQQGEIFANLGQLSLLLILAGDRHFAFLPLLKLTLHYCSIWAWRQATSSIQLFVLSNFYSTIFLITWDIALAWTNLFLGPCS